MDKSVDEGDNSNQPRKRKSPTNSSTQSLATLAVSTPYISFTGLKSKGEASHVNEFKPTTINDAISPKKNHGKNIMRINYSFPIPDKYKLLGRQIDISNMTQIWGEELFKH